MFLFHFIDILILPITRPGKQNKPLSSKALGCARFALTCLLGYQGDGSDCGFDLRLGVESTQAKPDRSLWKGPEGAMG